MMPRVPWNLILTKGLVLIDRATTLIGVTRDASLAIGAAMDVPSLRDQVAALSRNQQANADLLKEVTDHIDELTKGAEAVASRARWALAFGISGVVLGVVACLLALLMR